MTEFLGGRIEALMARQINGEPPDAPLAAWLEGLTPYLRGRLGKIGAIDARRARPLADHVEDFRRALLDKGNTAGHADLVAARTRQLFNGCGFRFWSDISTDKVLAHLADLRADKVDATGGKATKRGLSIQTSNFYLQAAKQFCRWMVCGGRAVESPLTHAKGLNVRTDRRHDRRALTVEELRTLLTAARGQPEYHGMSGPVRALLYRLAVETGLRQGEIRSLTAASFDLAGRPPTVTVAAAYSKRRREDVLLLRPELARELMTCLAGQAPAPSPAFPLPERDKMIQAFRADLTAAAIPYRDPAGRVADFHALRHTFITNLAASGVHPKTAQALARHSTITLTMDRYTHSIIGDEVAALAGLPDLSAPPTGAAEEMSRTGTDDAAAAPAAYDPLTIGGGLRLTKADHDVLQSEALPNDDMSADARTVA